MQCNLCNFLLAVAVVLLLGTVPLMPLINGVQSSNTVQNNNTHMEWLQQCIHRTKLPEKGNTRPKWCENGTQKTKACDLEFNLKTMVTVPLGITLNLTPLGS